MIESLAGNERPASTGIFYRELPPDTQERRSTDDDRRPPADGKTSPRLEGAFARRLAGVGFTAHGFGPSAQPARRSRWRPPSGPAQDLESCRQCSFRFLACEAESAHMLGGPHSDSGLRAPRVGHQLSSRHGLSGLGLGLRCMRRAEVRMKLPESSPHECCARRLSTTDDRRPAGLGYHWVWCGRVRSLTRPQSHGRAGCA